MVKRIAAILALVVPVAAAAAIVIGSRGGHPSPRPAPAVAAPAPPPKIHHPKRRKGLPPAPAQVRGAAARNMPIPILMYHVIGVRPVNTPYPNLWVTPGAFTAEMKALHRAGYWAITLRAAYNAWQQGAPLPRKPIVISFDDGYRGDFTHARPVLRSLGWPGVLNLVVKNVESGDLSAARVRALIRAGWEVDSHTVNHLDLTTLPDQQLTFEVNQSQQDLHSRFGIPADFFCYPAGHYDDRVIAEVRSAGYLAATTEVEGWARPPFTGTGIFTLPRVRVSDTDTAASLLSRLAAERPHA